MIASLPAAISVLGSGWLADKFGPRTSRGLCADPRRCLLISGPIHVFAITRGLSLAHRSLLGLVICCGDLQFGYLGITFATLQNLMHPRMRATASAYSSRSIGLPVAWARSCSGR